MASVYSLLNDGQRYQWPTPVRRLLVVLGFVTAVGSAACSSPEPPLASTVQEDSTLFWTLELNHWAATMSVRPPYDTLTLRAIPRNVHGDPLTSVPGARYESRDLDRVRVDAEGVIHAIAVTNPDRPVIVVATLTVGNLTHKDSVEVEIVDVDSAARPVLGSLSIHPVPPDSAKMGFPGIGMAFAVNLPVRVADTGGVAIPRLLTAIRPSDPQLFGYVPSFRLYRLVGQYPANTTFYASATAYGITKTDTLPYRIGFQVLSAVNIERVTSPSSSDTVAFSPAELKVGRGAMVHWASPELEGDVTFADADVPDIAPANTSALFTLTPTVLSPASYARLLCPSLSSPDCSVGGNIALVPIPEFGGFYGSRVFSRPGIYEYRSIALGARGRIVVVDEQE